LEKVVWLNDLYLISMKKILLLVSLIRLLTPKSFSQTTPVDSYAESVTRRNQLLSLSDTLLSFTGAQIIGYTTALAPLGAIILCIISLHK
jgi:hypothetical protein